MAQPAAACQAEHQPVNLDSLQRLLERGEALAAAGLTKELAAQRLHQYWDDLIMDSAARPNINQRLLKFCREGWVQRLLALATSDSNDITPGNRTTLYEHHIWAAAVWQLLALPQAEPDGSVPVLASLIVALARAGVLAWQVRVLTALAPLLCVRDRLVYEPKVTEMAKDLCCTALQIMAATLVAVMQDQVLAADETVRALAPLDVAAIAAAASSRITMDGAQDPALTRVGVCVLYCVLDLLPQQRALPAARRSRDRLLSHAGARGSLCAALRTALSLVPSSGSLNAEWRRAQQDEPHMHRDMVTQLARTLKTCASVPEFARWWEAADNLAPVVTVLDLWATSNPAACPVIAPACSDLLLLLCDTLNHQPSAPAGSAAAEPVTMPPIISPFWATLVRVLQCAGMLLHGTQEAPGMEPGKLMDEGGHQVLELWNAAVNIIANCSSLFSRTPVGHSSHKFAMNVLQAQQAAGGLLDAAAEQLPREVLQHGLVAQHMSAGIAAAGGVRALEAVLRGALREPAHPHGLPAALRCNLVGSALCTLLLPPAFSAELGERLSLCATLRKLLAAIGVAGRLEVPGYNLLSTVAWSLECMVGRDLHPTTLPEHTKWARAIATSVLQALLAAWQRCAPVPGMGSALQQELLLAQHVLHLVAALVRCGAASDIAAKGHLQLLSAGLQKLCQQCSECLASSSSLRQEAKVQCQPAMPGLMAHLAAMLHPPLPCPPAAPGGGALPPGRSAEHGQPNGAAAAAAAVTGGQARGAGTPITGGGQPAGLAARWAVSLVASGCLAQALELAHLEASMGLANQAGHRAVHHLATSLLPAAVTLLLPDSLPASAAQQLDAAQAPAAAIAALAGAMQLGHLAVAHWESHPQRLLFRRLNSSGIAALGAAREQACFPCGFASAEAVRGLPGAVRYTIECLRPVVAALTPAAQELASRCWADQDLLGQTRSQLPGCAFHGCSNWAGATEAALPTKRCAACGEVRYCSPACQKAAWRDHKPLCKRLREAAAAAGQQETQAPAAASSRPG